jgi:hypothetical protein
VRGGTVESVAVPVHEYPRRPQDPENLIQHLVAVGFEKIMPPYRPTPPNPDFPPLPHGG